MEEKILTTEQVASILQVHPFTILKFIKEGKLKGIKLGRVYRIKESDVREFIEERTTKPRENKIPRQEQVIPKQQESQTEGDHYYII